MTSVIQADEHRGFSVQPSWDAPLHMYYDETNNIRRLKLSEVGLNAPADRTFAIAGIALKPGQTLSGWDDLRRTMGIQANSKEVKFKHGAPPDYEAALGSRKLSIFLEWLVQSDFSVHFMHCLYVFKHASHVLDSETNIEKIMQRFEIRDGDRLVDYRFADSENEIGIQASDVVTGLVGRHFTYVQQHSLPELRDALARFSEQQLRNLGLLRELINKSDAFSDGFCTRFIRWTRATRTTRSCMDGLRRATWGDPRLA